MNDNGPWLELQRRRAAVLSRRPLPGDARELANRAFEAAVVSIESGQLADARFALAEGAATLSAGLMLAATEADDSAKAEVRWPDGMSRLFLPSEPPNPSEWWRALACALVVRDAAALEILCETTNLNALGAPAGNFDDFWLPLCVIASALVRGERIAPEDFSRVEGLFDVEGERLGDEAVIDSQIAPLLPMMRALSSGTGFDAALRNAVARHRAYFDSTPDAYPPYRALSLEALGLAALARDLGVSFDAGIFPEELLEVRDRPTLTTTLVYAPRYAEHAEDVTGFLDLRGYPRGRRNHSLIRRGADLIAHYELSGRPGVSHARAEFQLAGGGPPLPLVALDPGERLLLAELHGRDTAGVPSAIEFVEQVLAAIPPDADAIPVEAFVNVRGREMYEREPGRFRRDRLQAYLRGLTGGARSAGPDKDVLTSIALIRAQVEPLIEALCRLRDPQTIENVRPRDTDYDRVFTDKTVAAAAKAAYAAEWVTPERIGAPRSELSELRIHVSPAGMLATDNELLRHFPGGYRALAPALNPRVVWVAWKFTHPGETTGGLSFDGLAWIDDHWAWFPKPYRVLSGIPAP
ncbi:MAG TPA: Imm49 family immunity protein [Steroidobacteraceae bacterium]|nr:Imm49 family immunity protein [Steroidobacteraceae bacterium]